MRSNEIRADKASQTSTREMRRGTMSAEEEGGGGSGRKEEDGMNESAVAQSISLPPLIGGRFLPF